MMLKKFINAIRGKENLLDQALQRSQEMLEEDYDMFVRAVEALRQKDNSDLGFDIHEKDLKINKYEREVRAKVLTHLTFSDPGSVDLATGLSLVSIVIDIERIGDYTKNIAELAIAHPARLAFGERESEIQAIEKFVKGSFKKTKTAFKESDAEMARKVMRSYKRNVARKVEEMIQDTIRGDIRDLKVSEAVAMALYLRHLKRISAHLKNIATSIVNPFDRIGYQEKK